MVLEVLLTQYFSDVRFFSHVKYSNSQYFIEMLIVWTIFS